MKLSLRLDLYFLLIAFLIMRNNLNYPKENNKQKTDPQKTLSLLYDNLYNPQLNKVSFIINKFQEDLEKIPNIKSIIFHRIKSPLSIYKKFYTKENYQKRWNSMKDLLGFMIIVNTHEEIDDAVFYLKKIYSQFKNENDTSFVNDFRHMNIRTKKLYEYSQIKNNYQINNGYKTVRLNLIYEQYPIEIQIKTKEEYIAHKTTHDLIYKSNIISDENIKLEICDALFPLIEVLSHKFIYLNTSSPFNLEKCEKDIESILKRNIDLYNKYKNIIDSALELAAVYIFIFKNEKYFNLSKENNLIEEKLIECNILKVIKYLSHKNKNEFLLNLNNNDKYYNYSISSLVYMNYPEYKTILSQIEDLPIPESLSIFSINDIMRSKDLNIIDSLTKCYNKISFGIYNDELSKLFLGHKTIFSEEDRIKNIQSIKNIYNTGIIDNSGNLILKKNVINFPKNKKYKLCYLPGVFDMYHPGHRIYIEKVSELCSNVIIGLKSLNYSRQFKNKEPIFNETERRDILMKVKGVNDVSITNNDILPDNKTLNELIKYSPNSAIFLGSDWKTCENITNYIDHSLSLKDIKIEPKCKKSLISLEQYIYLKKNFPSINLVMIPRENSIHSSTNYRRDLLDNIQELNFFEIQNDIKY